MFLICSHRCLFSMNNKCDIFESGSFINNCNKMTEKDSIEQVVEEYVRYFIKKVIENIDCKKVRDQSKVTEPQETQDKPTQYSKSQSAELSVSSTANVISKNKISIIPQYKYKDDPKNENIEATFSPLTRLKLRKHKKTLKEIEMLSSCVEEIGRMNEDFKKKVLHLISQIRYIRRSEQYTDESLIILGDIPDSTIVLQGGDDSEPQATVNVQEFGISLLEDLQLLGRNFSNFLADFNDFRLRFIDLSEKFISIPFEVHVDDGHDAILDLTYEAAVRVYEMYFQSERYEVRYEQLESERMSLQNMVEEFDIYLNNLGSCV